MPNKKRNIREEAPQHRHQRGGAQHRYPYRRFERGIPYAKDSQKNGARDDQNRGPDYPIDQELSENHFFFSLRSAIFFASRSSCSGRSICLSTKPTNSSSTDPRQNRSMSCLAASTATSRRESTAR